MDNRLRFNNVIDFNTYFNSKLNFIEDYSSVEKIFEELLINEASNYIKNKEYKKAEKIYEYLYDHLIKKYGPLNDTFRICTFKLMLIYESGKNANFKIYSLYKKIVDFIESANRYELGYYDYIDARIYYGLLLANYHYYNGKCLEKKEEIIYIYKLCKSVYGIKHEKTIEIILELICFYLYEDDFNKILQLCRRILKIYSNNKDNIMDIVNLLRIWAKMKIVMGNLTSAKKILKKALNIAHKSNDILPSLILYNNIGLLYMKMQKYSESIKYLEKGFIISRKNKKYNNYFDSFLLPLNDLYYNPHVSNNMMQISYLDLEEGFNFSENIIKYNDLSLIIKMDNSNFINHIINIKNIGFEDYWI